MEVIETVQFSEGGGSDRRDWRTDIVGYSYNLMLASGTEVVAYHWHPKTPDSVTFPHVHVGPAIVGTDGSVRRGNAHKVHFPTGSVSLESFLRLLVTEFGVEPRRRDWEQILSDPT